MLGRAIHSALLVGVSRNLEDLSSRWHALICVNPADVMSCAAPAGYDWHGLKVKFEDDPNIPALRGVTGLPRGCLTTLARWHIDDACPSCSVNGRVGSILPLWRSFECTGPWRPPYCNIHPTHRCRLCFVGATELHHIKLVSTQFGAASTTLLGSLGQIWGTTNPVGRCEPDRDGLEQTLALLGRAIWERSRRQALMHAPARRAARAPLQTQCRSEPGR